MNPVADVAITAYYSLGDWDGYCNVQWTSPDQPPSVDVYYRVEARDIASGKYIWIDDVMPGFGDEFGVPVKFVTAPAGGSPKTRIVDIIRISSNQSGQQNSGVDSSITTPTTFILDHQTPSGFQRVCTGKIGELQGAIDVTWNDLTKFIRSGRITLSKYGITSPNIKRILYDSTFTGKASALGPNRAHIVFDLLPAGIQVPYAIEDVPPPGQPSTTHEARVARNININISNPGTSTIDSIALSNGDRVLLVGQSPSSANGIYVFNGSSSAMTRVADMNAWSEVYNAFVAVTEGVAYQGSGWFTNVPPTGTIGTTNIDFVQVVPTPVPQRQKLLWDPLRPPTDDPRAPFWVAESDIITFTLATTADDDPVQKVVEFSFAYHREAYFREVFRSLPINIAPQDRGDRIILQVEQDPYFPMPITPKIDYISGLPPGMTFVNGMANWIEDAPIVLGVFKPIFHVTSDGGYVARQHITIDVFVIMDTPSGAWPVITSPPPSVILARGVPYPSEFNLDGPGGGFTVDTGTLPSGLTLNPTGSITGIPDTLEAPHNVVFKQFGTSAWGPLYTVSYSVVQGAAPLITSAPTMDASQGLLAAYSIDTNIPVDDYRAHFLPEGMVLKSGVITGVPSVSPGPYPVYLQARNVWGWGPMFQLIISIDIEAPVIFSPALVQDLNWTGWENFNDFKKWKEWRDAQSEVAYMGEAFNFRVAATNNPIYYGAENLPEGLTINPETGEILGTPTRLGSYDVKLKAVNSGGVAEATMLIAVDISPVPVIDTSALTGRALTLQINEVFVFQPSASHNPTSWTMEPLTQGLSFDASTGRLSGQFSANGLYSITFTAYNSGGASLPVTFYFMVGTQPPVAGQPPPPAPRVPLDQVDLWIDLDYGSVGINQSDASGVSMTVKRGDSILVNVIFHRNGIPVDTDLLNLYFGAKQQFDEPYIVSSTDYIRVAEGKYRIYPDFSDQNNELDQILTGESTELIGEIQWDLADLTRHSTRTFPVTVLRDLLHPDPALGS